VTTVPDAAPLSGDINIFLIADVRGYTSFTQQRGDAAAARLAGTFAEIARTVVEEHNGSIEIRNRDAAGAEIAIRLPTIGETRRAGEAAVKAKAG